MEYQYAEIPRVYTAIAEWLSCLIYIIPATKRFDIKRTVVICPFFLGVQTVYLWATDNVPTFFWIPCMLGAFLLMFLFLICVIKVNCLQAGYLLSGAILCAEFMASLMWQLYSFIRMSPAKGLFLNIVFIAGIYGAVFVIFLIIEKSLISRDYLNHVSYRDLISASLLTVIAFFLSNLSFVVQDVPFTGSLTGDIFNIRTLVDFAGLSALVAVQSRVGELLAEREAANISVLFRSQYAQYKNYLESMEYIHLKYHDLKHQIAGLRGESDAEKRKEWLDAMENELNEYELSYPTGNNVLDAILGAKLLQAKKNDIRLTYVINGPLLDFINVTDLCSLFGNALDNAIESVTTVSEPEKRLIHITVSGEGDYVVIGFLNYHTGKMLRDEGGLPITTKEDRINHGYGLKSMEKTVQKYGGRMFIENKNDFFELRIVIPMKQG